MIGKESWIILIIGRMDLVRKRKSWIPTEFKRKNKITDDFKEKLTGFLADLGRNNHYIMFLHDQISREFGIQLAQIQSESAVSDETKEPVDLVEHPFPLSNKKIQFLPMFMDADDPVYKTDMDELTSWVSKNRDPAAFFKMTKDYYSKKKSWVVQKILSLSEDFVKELMKISQEKGIPLPSLHNMYILMTGINDFFQSEENFASLPMFLHYPVPASVSPDQRDNRIITVWNRIYNLLVECYWVLLVVGMVDMLNIAGNYQEEGLEEARNYLMHSVIYSKLEKQVLLIKNADDLRGYIQKEFSVFETFFPDFSEFVLRAVIPIIEKRERILSYPVTQITFTSIEVYEGELMEEKSFYDPEAEMIEYLTKKEVLEKFGGKIKSKTKLGDSASVHESLKQEDGRDSDTPGREEIILDERDQEEFSNKTPLLSESNVMEDFEEKMEATGLLKTYRLSGSPDKMIHYLFKIISNVSLTINDKIYSQKLKEFYGISSVSWRRWLRLIKEGKIQLPSHPDRPSGVRSINDLFEDEVQEIMRDMKDRKEHHKEGYLSQNQLIAMFQNDILRLGLNKRMGIELIKYSRTALRNILNKLIKENRIPFEKFGAANLFKITDIPKIAQEIASFYSRNDS